jgi:dCMP deaminase
MKKSNKEILSVDEWKEYKEKVDRLSWEQYFILQAYLVATRSLDAQTQCGCVIVNKENIIIATGYNSFIGRIDDSVLPNLRPEKYPFMMHCEQNAIFACAKNGNSCKGCTVYVTGRPCVNCFQSMHQAGISRVVYHKDHSIYMVDTPKQKFHYDVLESLSSMEIYGVTYDESFMDKISKIKSCR